MQGLKACLVATLAVVSVWAGPAYAATVVVSGAITTDTTWTSDNDYLLSGAVFVRSGATLTIEAGTTIFGESATNGTLIIDRGAQIMAVGTKKKPIVFTSDQEPGRRARGDWGGLILNGFAQLNVPGGEAQGEGDTGTYGGSDDHDSSGQLMYVRVEFAGTEFSPDNELNGIAFQGVGDGTLVQFIQVHMNLDDGMEFFGGKVNVKWALCTYIGDDSFDSTDGWRGYGQFWIGQQRADDADQGFEFDNNAENNNLTPLNRPTIYNVTLIGDPDLDAGSESDIGMLLREGTGADLGNLIVTGFKEWGVVITDTKTFKNARESKLSVVSSIFFDNGQSLARFGGDQSRNWSKNLDDSPVPSKNTADYMAQWANNVIVDPGLRKPFLTNLGRSARKPKFRPGKKSPAVNGMVPVATPPNGEGFFTTDVSFIGALGPKNRDDWTKGWTTYVGS